MVIFARWFASALALATLGLYLVLAFFNPFAPSQLTAPIAIMMVVSMAGIFAAALMRPLAMTAVFAAWFVPVGFYLLGTPGIFRLIGIFNLLYLLAGAILLIRKQSNKRPPESTAT